MKKNEFGVFVMNLGVWRCKLNEKCILRIYLLVYSCLTWLLPPMAVAVDEV